MERPIISLFLCVALAVMSFTLGDPHCSSDDSLALLQFNQSLAVTPFCSISEDYEYSDYDAFPCESSYPKTSSWNRSTDCCTWNGVGCDSSTGHVVALDLGCSQLKGTIHSNSSLFQLRHLQTLVLSYNCLEGKIPDDPFSNLKKLRILELRDNGFVGPFPSSLVNLTELQYLSLKNNSLTGPLPLTSSSPVLQNLSHLDLSQNSFNGSIPSWLFSLPSLIDLRMESNHFSGQLSPFKSNSLSTLDLYQNQLFGPIPRSFRDLVNLVSLTLGQNKLSGEVRPEMFSNMTYLVLLDLSSNNLSGVVGVEMLSTMTNLISLDLSRSGLSWSNNNNTNITIPELLYLSLGSCHVQHFPTFFLNSKGLVSLDLSGNEIHGKIPKGFEDLTALTTINLSHNYLTSLDHLPWEGMNVLDLQSNAIAGTIPSSLCTSKHLVFLDLSYNNLTSQIPICLFTSTSQLVVLDLRANNFHGPIPNEFPKNSSLVHLSLSKNQLEGPMPTSLINCTSLRFVDFGNNNIRDTFPAWMEMLRELEVFILKFNRFYGPIDDFQTKLPFSNLRIFDISGNSFSGSLPIEILKGFKIMMNMHTHKSKLEYIEEQYIFPGFNRDRYVNEESVGLVMKNEAIEFGKILKIFTTIDLSMNKFEGEIPKLLGNFNSLLLLNLSRNNLTGHIPVEMKNMSVLEALDLSFNQLTGRIPEELTSLTFLVILNVSHNQLAGPIPRQNQFNTFPNDSYVGNSGLCGFPLSNECGHKRSTVPSGLLGEHEEDEESSFASEFTWKSVLIGYGCGLTFGFTILYFIYRYERPRWYIEFIESITPRKTYRSKRAGQRRRNFRR